MPNWVTIDLTVESETAEQVKSFVESVKDIDENGIENPFSFEKIIPMPKALKGTCKGSHGDIGYAAWYGDPTQVLNYQWVKDAGVTNVEQLREFLEKQSPEYKADADAQKAAFDETGFTTWYGWCIENWGTKWDSCHVDVTESTDFRFSVRFDTAWSFPEPIIKALSEKFPELKFSGNFTEESDAFEGEFSYSRSEGLSFNCWEPEPRDEEEEDEVTAEVTGEKIAANQANTWF